MGRGAAESWCFLVSDNASESVQKRLKFLCSTSDGFAVAQYDLETRGPGDFFGSRQHGLPTLQIADLMNDTRPRARLRPCWPKTRFSSGPNTPCWPVRWSRCSTKPVQ